MAEPTSSSWQTLDEISARVRWACTSALQRDGWLDERELMRAAAEDDDDSWEDA